jgi:hypothetical protein
MVGYVSGLAIRDASSVARSRASHVLMTVLCAGVSKTQHNWVELAEWAADIRSRQTPDSKAGTEAPLLQRAPPGQTAPGHALLPLSS